MAFCHNCGAALEDGAAFCASCGAKVENQTTQNQQQQPPQYQNYVPVQVPNDNMAPVVSIWAYIGMAILFALPVIGLIANIIFCFAPENRSIKNYAIAYLILIIAAVIILAGTIGIIFAFFKNAVSDIGGNYNDFDWDDLFEDFEMSGIDISHIADFDSALCA